MFGKRTQVGFQLARRSRQVLAGHRQLLLFPLAQTVGAVLALAIASPLGLFAFQHGNSRPAWIPFAVVALFLSNLNAVFWGVAFVDTIVAFDQGREVSLRSGTRAAWGRLPQILGWATLATIVGILVRALQRFGLAGAIVSWLAGLAWAVATLFVIPVLACEGLSPVDALKRSVGVLKARWGEQLAGSVNIGFVYTLRLLGFIAGGFIAAVLAFQASVPLGVLVIVVAACGVLYTLAAAAAASRILNYALYRYATTGVPALGFEAGELEQAIIRK